MYEKESIIKKELAISSRAASEVGLCTILIEVIDGRLFAEMSKCGS